MTLPAETQRKFNQRLEVIASAMTRLKHCLRFILESIDDDDLRNCRMSNVWRSVKRAAWRGLFVALSIVAVCIIVAAHGGNEIWLPLAIGAVAGAKTIAGNGGKELEMKVRELIEALGKTDQELDVIITFDDESAHKISSIEIADLEDEESETAKTSKGEGYCRASHD